MNANLFFCLNLILITSYRNPRTSSDWWCVQAAWCQGGRQATESTARTTRNL